MTAARSDLMELAEIFEEIEVDEHGKCDWTAVANAQAHLRAQLRLAASQPDREAVARTICQKTPDCKFGEGVCLQCQELTDAILSLLSGAGTPAPAVGADVGRRVLDILNAVAPAVENLAGHQEQCDIDGAMVKVSRQALDEVLNAVNEVALLSALTRPLGGLVQGSIADCGQSNEQSAQGPSRADVCDAGVQQTWDECPECGASSNDLCGKVFSQIVAETDADAQRDDGLLSGVSADPINSGGPS